VAERSDSGTATATFRADAGGTMIWSTAWNGFVSGALRYLASATL
jgi:hypothetical protein